MFFRGGLTLAVTPTAQSKTPLHALLFGFKPRGKSTLFGVGSLAMLNYSENFVAKFMSVILQRSVFLTCAVGTTA
jgi:hypothetical protein